jgi:hypothetical protein
LDALIGCNRKFEFRYCRGHEEHRTLVPGDSLFKLNGEPLARYSQTIAAAMKHLKNCLSRALDFMKAEKPPAKLGFKWDMTADKTAFVTHYDELLKRRFEKSG